MQTIDVLAHPWLQIMLKQVEIGDNTCTGRIACQIMQLMDKLVDFKKSFKRQNGKLEQGTRQMLRPIVWAFTICHGKS